MKKTIILVLLSFTVIFGHNNPVAGKKFKIKYTVEDSKVFNSKSTLKLVYAFDYWGTKGSARNGAEDLFKNITDPDEGRSFEQTMVNKIKYFETEILIPDSVALLSYYVTDGKNYDYNNKNTYVKYVYNKDGKPVKGARFRNVDFMIMAGKSNDDVIEELNRELKDYPDYHSARTALWNTKFNNAKNYNEFEDLKNQFEEEFAELKKEFKNDYALLNAEGQAYITYFGSINNWLYELYKANQEKIVSICEQIPEGKRSEALTRVYEHHLRSKKAEKFKEEAIGKAAADFEFESVDGNKMKLSDFKGKYVLLDFWGTWCGPCRSEIPNLRKAYAEYKKKGFEIISISSDLMMKSKKKDEFVKFVKENKMAWTQVLDGTDKKLHTLYKISHWPTLFLIDKKGNIIKNEDVLRGEDLMVTLKEVIK